VFFRETPDETFVELVDVSVLETLTAADGEYYIIWMSVLTSQDMMTMLHLFCRHEYTTYHLKNCETFIGC
jgi:hypothetical protein